MKNRWVYIILAISLGINLAVFTTFAYYRFFRAYRRTRILRHIKQASPRDIEPLLEDYYRKMDSLRRKYWRTRHYLAGLSLEEKPNSEEVERTLKEIGEIHQEMNRLVYETARKTGRLLPPKHRAEIRHHWRRMMEGPHLPPPPRHPGKRPPRRI